MNEKRTAPRTVVTLTLWLMFVLIACNLGTAGGTPPPTLVPRATLTPQPTLGYNGVPVQDGTGGNVQPDNVSTPATSIDVELYTLMQQVDIERLMAHVQTLQSFHTRHVNSSQTSPHRASAQHEIIFTSSSRLCGSKPLLAISPLNRNPLI
jgi:hypothetical protein